jgi:predicted acylesterase/phospholipase RssA
MASDCDAPVDRFCDLVMKGGIASGVVYPLAIVELASRYRFRSIGGTSAGAVAAAVTAAAEYRRRHQDTMAGFDVVKRIATDLRQRVDAAPKQSGKGHWRGVTGALRRTLGGRLWPASAARLRLQCLFAPDPNCERLFHVLVRTLSRAHRTGHLARRSRAAAAKDRQAAPGEVEKAGDRQPAGQQDKYVESMPRALTRALLVAYWPMVIAGAVAGVVLGLLCGWRIGVGIDMPLLAWLAGTAAGIATGLLAAAAVVVGGTAWWFRRDIVCNVVPNDFGLCHGDGTSPEGVDRITPWLNELIQTAAGLPVHGDPLTFGQLWDAPGFPPPSMPVTEVGEHRSIDLMMFTTNVTHGRPYTFPHHDERAQLFYQPDKLASFLPASVMDWISAHPGTYEPDAGKKPTVASMEALGLVPIPDAKDFPVLLAARMSLSYPLLFSAVPLWAIDYEQPDDVRSFRRCWFSDGGIASNFPMHLFDHFLPAWPTFGIDLEGILPGSCEYVYLPPEPQRGIADRWNRFDDEKADSTRFAGFLLAVISTMQNWNDNTNARMPGVRDRIARVRLREEEGGFNLDMPTDCQEEVAARGCDAALRLIARFAGDHAPAAGWDAQRWTRLEVLARTLEKRMPGVLLALRDDLPATTSYAELAANGGMRVSGSDAEVTPEQQQFLATLLDVIGNAAAQLGSAAGNLKTRPTPDPDLRVRAPL